MPLCQAQAVEEAIKEADEAQVDRTEIRDARQAHTHLVDFLFALYVFLFIYWFMMLSINLRSEMSPKRTK